MIVAMVAVLVVEPAIDDIANVIAMRNGLVPATGGVLVAGIVAAATLSACGATAGVGAIHFQNMLLDRGASRVMQVPIVEIAHMIAVLNRSVAATGTMLMRVVGVGFAAHFVVLLLAS